MLKYISLGNLIIQYCAPNTQYLIFCENVILIYVCLEITVDWENNNIELGRFYITPDTKLRFHNFILKTKISVDRGCLKEISY